MSWEKTREEIENTFDKVLEGKENEGTTTSKVRNVLKELQKYAEKNTWKERKSREKRKEMKIGDVI